MVYNHYTTAVMTVAGLIEPAAHTAPKVKGMDRVLVWYPDR